MKKINYSLFLFLILSSQYFAQNLDFGFKTGPNIVSRQVLGESESKVYFPISHISAIVELDIFKDLRLSIQPGYSFPSEDYFGLDIDFLLKKNILINDLYLIGGYGVHFNNEQHHGLDPVTFIKGKEIHLINLGAGFQVLHSTFIEIQYALPTEKKIGYENSQIYGDFDIELNNILKFSIGVIF